MKTNNQPSVVITMKAKPSKGDELFDLCFAAKSRGRTQPDDPVDWILRRSDEDPDTICAFEFFRDDESMLRRYAIPAAEAEIDRIMELLADAPRRVDIRIAHTSEEAPSCL